MPIIVNNTCLLDVLVIHPTVFHDDRGWFFESFNEKDFFNSIGYSVTFLQDNHSFSKKGVLRGLHYQTEQPQGKLVKVYKGSVFDVVVDLRQSSATFGKWFGIELSAENKKQLWVPPGFAHGFLVLSESAELLYKTTTYWHADSEQCIAWDDPFLNIDWPIMSVQPTMSSKDRIGKSWNISPKF